MGRINKSLIFLMLIGVIAIAVAASGCTGSNDNGTTLSGKDIFDPAEFSMARYDVTLNDSGMITHRIFLVTTGKNEQDGDRLTSNEIDGNNSVKTDVWINKERTAATNVLITVINSSTLMITGGYPPFNMTTADKAWNPLEATYALAGHENVTNNAGQFENCSIYVADRQLGFGDTIITTRVYYYMHPSSPVPVRYVVEMPTTSYAYDLYSAYGPNDMDSTPERVIQAFFDSLNQGDTDSASSYVVTYDSAEDKFKPLTGSSYQEFLQGTGAMYGDKTDDTHVQYVLTTLTQETQPTGGKNLVAASWTSVQYQYEPLTAFELNGKLNVVNIGGHWKIVG